MIVKLEKLEKLEASSAQIYIHARIIKCTAVSGAKYAKALFT